MDPVLHPKKKFGDIANYSRIAYWDLSGRLLAKSGNVRGLNGDQMSFSFGETPAVDQWEDLSFGSLGGDDGMEPDDWGTVGPIGFGALTPDYGIIDGRALEGLGVEVDEEP